MAIVDVLRALHTLKKERVIKDYLLFGSVAAMVHTRPFFTRDIDVGVEVRNDQEFMKVFTQLANFGKVEGHAVIFKEPLSRYSL